MIPIKDLTTGSFIDELGNPHVGGLYPSGSNTMPVSYSKDYKTWATSKIKPLDYNGVKDLTNGKIIFLSVGPSNTSKEFKNLCDKVASGSIPNINPYVVTINGAKGGTDINNCLDINDPYFDDVITKVTDQGYSYKQVQVIWLKNSDKVTPEGGVTYNNFVPQLYGKMKTCISNLQVKFPNLKIVYLQNRSCGEYVVYEPSKKTLMEPGSYYQGWVIKQLIEDQINGDPTMNYKTGNFPLLCWSDEWWANGATPRMDGLFYLSTDFVSDGLHPNTNGLLKLVDGRLIPFLTTSTKDPYAYKWFTTNN